MSLTPETIGRYAVHALRTELSVTPKPGLVDQNNSGAHCDMDYALMETSITTLAPYFYQFAQFAFDSDLPPVELFNNVRSQGVLAEQKMLSATDGINTHRGALFSLGLVCAAAGHCVAREKKVSSDLICLFTSQMTVGICHKELLQLKKVKEPSHGEQVFLKYGIQGIREEAENGFPTIRQQSLPLLKSILTDTGISQNDALLQVLLLLMAVVPDTNILYRHNRETALRVQESARRILAKDTFLSTASLGAIEALDQDFIQQNISPGGSADLLAVTFFLYLIDNQP